MASPLVPSPVPVVLLLTQRQAAEALSLSERKLWGLVHAGEIPVVRVGRMRRYRIADLQAWIDRNTQPRKESR